MCATQLPSASLTPWCSLGLMVCQDTASPRPSRWAVAMVTSLLLPWQHNCCYGDVLLPWQQSCCCDKCCHGRTKVLVMLVTIATIGCYGDNVFHSNWLCGQLCCHSNTSHCHSNKVSFPWQQTVIKCFLSEFKWILAILITLKIYFLYHNIWMYKLPVCIWFYISLDAVITFTGTRVTPTGNMLTDKAWVLTACKLTNIRN